MFGNAHLPCLCAHMIRVFLLLNCVFTTSLFMLIACCLTKTSFSSSKLFVLVAPDFQLLSITIYIL